MFAPRAFAGDAFVDGGVLQNIPLQAAQSVGVTSCFAILADPLACPAPTQDYADADFVQVGVRAEMTVAFYGQQQRDLQAARSLGMAVTLIDPTVTVVSSFETEPGLLSIAMDYGWLRACAVTSTGSDAAAHRAADQIAAGRVRAWYLEAGLGGSGPDVDAALKSSEGHGGGGAGGMARPGPGAAEGADRWSTEPELHTSA